MTFLSSDFSLKFLPKILECSIIVSIGVGKTQDYKEMPHRFLCSEPNPESGGTGGAAGPGLYHDCDIQANPQPLPLLLQTPGFKESFYELIHKLMVLIKLNLPFL